jgi:hypothetical protein
MHWNAQSRFTSVGQLWPPAIRIPDRALSDDLLARNASHRVVGDTNADSCHTLNGQSDSKHHVVDKRIGSAIGLID